MNLTAFHQDRHQLGVSRALARALYYRLQKLAGYRVYRLVLLTAEAPATEPADSAVTDDFRVLDHAQLAALAEDPENRLSDRLLRNAAQRGDLCIGLVRDGHLANQGWYTQQPTIVDEPLVAAFPERYMYMYAGYTRPEYRGERLHGRSFSYALEYFASKNQQGIIGFAELVNYASLRSALRVGYRHQGYIIWPGFGRCWQSPGCKPHKLIIEAKQ